MSGGENGVRGRVYALDAKTGHEVWRFYTDPGAGRDRRRHLAIAQRSRSGQARRLPARRRDGLAGAGDRPRAGHDVLQHGQRRPDYDGSVRPGDNLFTASIVALDYKTGQYKWHFQEVHHEIWDYDAPSPVVLFDQMYNGQLRKGLYQAGKTGWLYFLDRTNGQPLIGIDEKPVPQEPRQATAATQPYPVGDAFVDQCAGAAARLPARRAASSRRSGTSPVAATPTGGGGSNWSPTSYNPQTGFVYVMGSEQTQRARPCDQRRTCSGKRYTARGSADAARRADQQHVHRDGQPHQQDRLAEARPAATRATAR